MSVSAASAARNGRHHRDAETPRRRDAETPRRKRTTSWLPDDAPAMVYTRRILL